MEMTEREEIRLREWEELIGTFRGIVKKEFGISICIEDSKLVLHPDSVEATMAEEQLDGVHMGTKIALLRTDIPEKPILIRIDGRSAGHQKADSRNGN